MYFMREEYIFNIHAFICADIHTYMHAFIKKKKMILKRKRSKSQWISEKKEISKIVKDRAVRGKLLFKKLMFQTSDSSYLDP